MQTVKVIEILDGQEFECPECQNELFPTQSEGKGNGLNMKNNAHCKFR